MQKHEVTFSDDIFASVDVVFAQAPYYLNLTYGSRQTVANQNGTDVHSAFDWSAFTLRIAGNALDDDQVPDGKMLWLLGG